MPYWLWCTQIFYHIGQGPVHPKCMLTYRPDTNILSYRSESGTPKMRFNISAGRYNTPHSERVEVIRFFLSRSVGGKAVLIGKTDR